MMFTNEHSSVPPVALLDLGWATREWPAAHGLLGCSLGPEVAILPRVDGRLFAVAGEKADGVVLGVDLA